MPDKKTPSNTIEAANRAEATAILIRFGYRVYRPEADVEGEDLVVRPPGGELVPVQLKPRPYVDHKRYGGKGLSMLFPIERFSPDQPRMWFIVPHDDLYCWAKDNLYQSRPWGGYWHTPKASEALRNFLASYQVRPPAEPEIEISN